MEEEISTTSPTHSKEILILTHLTGHEITLREISQILNTFRLHTARIFASIFIFTQLLTLGFLFRMGRGTDKKNGTTRPAGLLSG